jgi:hypothetical protein
MRLLGSMTGLRRQCQFQPPESSDQFLRRTVMKGSQFGGDAAHPTQHFGS